MTLLLCDQPQDDEPRLPCMDTAVYGTSRCLQHQPPVRRQPSDKALGTVVVKPLTPIPATDVLAGEGPKPAGWVGCGCGNCPEVPPAPEQEPGGSETGGNAPAELYTINPDAEPPHGADGLTLLRAGWPRIYPSAPIPLGPEPGDGPPYTHRYVPPDEDEPPAPSYTVKVTEDAGVRTTVVSAPGGPAVMHREFVAPRPPSRRGWRHIFRRRTA